MKIYINYQSKTCNGNNSDLTGKLVFSGGITDIVKIGQNYWYDPNWPNFYDPTHDYFVLQTSRNVGKLASYNIEFAGWERWPNFRAPGAAIGHPNRDVKKVNINYQTPFFPTSDKKTFQMFWDVGASEPGFSGGPVFNGSGWHYVTCIVITQNYQPLATCGNSQSSCLNFEIIYPNISSFIDPTNQSMALSKIYSPSLVDFPAHCSNCVRQQAVKKEN